MSVKQVRCSGCGSVATTVVKVHNPDTKSMNADATLKCDECGHEWEDRVASDHHRKMRSQGRVW